MAQIKTKTMGGFMKGFMTTIAILMAFFFGGFSLMALANAQEAPAPIEQVVQAPQEQAPQDQGDITAKPTEAEWLGIFGKLGTAQGAGTAGMMVLAIQAIMLAIRQFVEMGGNTKFYLVGFLSLLASLGEALMSAPQITGMVVLTAICSAPFMAAVNVFVHQVAKRRPGAVVSA